MRKANGLRCIQLNQNLLILFVVSSLGCSDPSTLPFDLPSNFPPPRQPLTNVATPAKIELGRHLFYEKRLSRNHSQACSSCHLQALAFTDGKTVSVGSTGQKHPRNSPTLTNAAYNATFTWANPHLTELETQILVPLFGDAPVELGATSTSPPDEILADPAYAVLFQTAFPEVESPTWDHFAQALACFVRSMISGDSPFDKFVYENDASALSESALKGMSLFYSERLECHHCHGGFNFTESSVHENSAFSAARFHNTGLYNIDEDGSYPPDNTGLYEVTEKPEDMGKFRAPTLRNIGVTAPYMHDGSVDSLYGVVRLYEDGGRFVKDGPWFGDGRKNQWKSGFVAGFTLTDQEREDLVHFLESLTDEDFLTDPRLSNPFEQARAQK